MKKWYDIQFLIIGVISILYSVWSAVLSAYGINTHGDIFFPALLGILVTSGLLMVVMTIFKVK